MMSYFGLREWKFSNKNIDQLATLLKTQSKPQTYQHNSLESAFSLQQQNGVHANVKSIKNHTIHNKLNSKPKSSLEFDMRTIDWDEYFCHYWPGIKKYFFKESIPDKEKCTKPDFK